MRKAGYISTRHLVAVHYLFNFLNKLSLASVYTVAIHELSFNIMWFLLMVPVKIWIWNMKLHLYQVAWLKPPNLEYLGWQYRITFLFHRYKPADYYLKLLIEEWCEGDVQNRSQNKGQLTSCDTAALGPQSLLLEKVAEHLQDGNADSLSIDLRGLSRVQPLSYFPSLLLLLLLFCDGDWWGVSGIMTLDPRTYKMKFPNTTRMKLYFEKALERSSRAWSSLLAWGTQIFFMWREWKTFTFVQIVI